MSINLIQGALTAVILQPRKLPTDKVVAAAAMSAVMPGLLGMLLPLLLLNQFKTAAQQPAAAPAAGAASASAPATAIATATPPGTATATATPPGTATATPPGTATATATPPGTATATTESSGTKRA